MIQRLALSGVFGQYAGDQRPLRRIAESVQGRPRRTYRFWDRRDHVTGYASPIDEQ